MISVQWSMYMIIMKYDMLFWELWISILFEAVLQHMTRYNSAKDENFFRLASGPAVLPKMNSTQKKAKFRFWAGNLKFWFFVFFFPLYIYIFIYCINVLCIIVLCIVSQDI